MTGAADMRPSLLPPDILPLFSDAFVRSCDLYEEYVFRLTLDVFRKTGLEAVCVAPVTTGEAIAQAGLDASRSSAARPALPAHARTSQCRSGKPATTRRTLAGI